MPDLRVLVTGSREFPSEDAVWERLAFVIAENLDAGDTLTVVHGDCPRGADRFARRWCALPNDEGVTVVEERHPADWNQYGKRAGFLRNQAMVDLGADLVLAFPFGEARGTRHCMTAAEKAGLWVEVVAPVNQPRLPTHVLTDITETPEEK